MSAHKKVSRSRRTFLAAVPAAVADAIATGAWAQHPAPPRPAGPLTTDMLRAAEPIDGVKFTAEEEQAALSTVNNNLNAYERLRELKMPRDTEPAYVFRPALPGKEPKGPANLEEVAFWPVTRLAALVEHRLVTSTELTRMYLDRLKRIRPKLLFYVSLTEELALKQAADADRAIAAGRYKGPLHGGVRIRPHSPSWVVPYPPLHRTFHVLPPF